MHKENEKDQHMLKNIDVQMKAEIKMKKLGQNKANLLFFSLLSFLFET